MLATDYTILALPLLSIGLFFGPSLLAFTGIGNRWAWFGLATLALIFSMGSCLSSWSAAMAPPDAEIQNVGVTGIVASSMFILAFLGCLLAGFFYREKKKPST